MNYCYLCLRDIANVEESPRLCRSCSVKLNHFLSADKGEMERMRNLLSIKVFTDADKEYYRSGVKK